MTAPAAIHPTSTAPYVRGGVLVLTGYGLRLAVTRGHLMTEDGLADDRRYGRFPRVGSSLQRVVVAGHGGTVSLDALQWLYETGTAFIQLNPDAQILTIGGPPTLHDVVLRRAQAFAPYNGTGVVIAKRLVHAKLAGQAHTLRLLPSASDVAAQLAALLPVLDAARTIDRVRYIEARAAAAYWQAWDNVPMTFPTRDGARVPAHWQVAGPRRSALSQGPIKATSPTHALLNYCYAIVEAEATLALRAVGCDPALGVLHVDTPSRASLACDLMEPVRPLVDAFVLRMLRDRVFLRSDFFERRDGNCRLMPTLTRPLAATAPEWAERLAPVAEEVASMLRTSPAPEPVQATDAPLPEWVPRLFRSPLTGQNRSRRRFRPTLATRAPELAKLALGNRCRACGVDMGTRERAFCDTCLQAHREASAARGAEVLRTVSASRPPLPSLRTPETRRKMAARTKADAERRRTWEEAHGGRPNPGRFRAEFRDRLHVIPIEQLMRATGMTRSGCRAFREGRTVPHPMHWEAIRGVVTAFEASHGPDVRFDQRTPDYARFHAELGPHLGALGAKVIHRVTGLSLSYARRVLHGHHVPHPRHWPALLAALREQGLTPVRPRKRGVTGA